MTWVLVKLGVRLLVFVAVFWLVAWRYPKVRIQPRWAIPLVAGVFAVLNTGLYWLLKPVLNLATFGGFALVLPLALNGLFLWATARVLGRTRWLRFDGIGAAMWLAVVLTATHVALYVGLDWLPPRM